MQINVLYASIEGSPQGLTNLYYDNGNGLREEECIYQKIENNRVIYEFHPKGYVNKIRILSNRLPGQIVYLKSINVLIDNYLIGKLEKNTLINSIVPSESSVSVHTFKDNIKLSNFENSEWEYATYNNSLLDLVNKISFGTLIRSLFFLSLAWTPVLITLLVDSFMTCKKNTYFTSHKLSILIFSIVFLFSWIGQKQFDLFWRFAIWLLPFMFYPLIYVRKSNISINILSYVISQIMIIFAAEWLPPLMTEATVRWTIDYIWLLGILWLNSLSILSLISGLISKTPSDSYQSNDKLDFVQLILVFVFMGCLIYETLKWRMFNIGANSPLLRYLIDRILNPIYYMNLLWIIIAWISIYALLGKGLSILILGICYLVILIGNCIKLKFHGTFLTPLDFLQVKEMVFISKSVLNKKTWLIIIITIITIVVIIMSCKKQLNILLRPKVSLCYFLIYGNITLSFSNLITNDYFRERNIFYKGYENEIVNENDSGLIFYNLLNLSKIKDVFPSEPNDYSLDTVENIKEGFPSYGNYAVVKPYVILIMAESLFDIENINDVTFNTKIEPTFKKYSQSKLISPRYGGYTAAVEFEALTGLSLSFFSNATMPYTTYFNQKDKKVPSIAHEFKKNGYLTFALHPNNKTFYNRDTAYKMLGFDTFLDKNSFNYTSENVVAQYFLKDMPVAEKITEIVDNSENPAFIFAVTIAGHYMAADRFAYTDIAAQSEYLNEKEIHELEQAATAFRDTDRMFKSLINYIDNSDKPILLYVFGDHLPPLPAFEHLNYTQNLYNKYSTILAAYSNYTEITFPEYITPNQLAAQIMLDSGVKHSQYYDYIFSLRNICPILQRDFIDIDDISNLNIYKMIQYDLMFGKQWFYEN